MKYCKKCVMPDTRPGIQFNSEGVCSACLSHEAKSSVDWDARMVELQAICDKYRGMNGPTGYDCAVAVSGGKDSHFQVYVMKELMGMNPILFSVEDNFTMTEAGKHNIRNIADEFGCNIISLKPNIKAQRILTRHLFEKYAKPLWFIERLILTYPVLMALKFNTPLLVYGENISLEYGGLDNKETYSARHILKNNSAADMPREDLLIQGITEKDLLFTEGLTNEALNQVDPIYLSYFVPWNSVRNYTFAKSRGFKTLEHEWNRSMHVENFDQIDCYAYLLHSWLKYPKFGHASATDYSARLVRYGILTREEAVELVRQHDHRLDSKTIDDFLQFTGYSRSEFYRILDGFYNRDLFMKDDFDRWVLKDPVWGNEKKAIL